LWHDFSINKGLFVLGQVVSALSERGSSGASSSSSSSSLRKPPFRESKLTRLLQNSLGGNSRTIMVACVSPADFNIDESINTLRYATSARKIQSHATRNIIQNISPQEAAALLRENQLLKNEVRELQETVKKLTQSGLVLDSAQSMDGSSSSSRDNVRGDVLVLEPIVFVCVSCGFQTNSQFSHQNVVGFSFEYITNGEWPWHGGLVVVVVAIVVVGARRDSGTAGGFPPNKIEKFASGSPGIDKRCRH
jgi:hypothetical protein